MLTGNWDIYIFYNKEFTNKTKEAFKAEVKATHQLKLHDAHTVSKNISGSTKQFREGTQSVEFKGRTSNLTRDN